MTVHLTQPKIALKLKQDMFLTLVERHKLINTIHSLQSKLFEDEDFEYKNYNQLLEIWNGSCFLNSELTNPTREELI